MTRILEYAKGVGKEHTPAALTSFNPSLLSLESLSAMIEYEKYVEWFAGIGGFHCALMDTKDELLKNELKCPAPKVVAIDINQVAKSAYIENFDSQYLTLNIDSLKTEKLLDLGIDPGDSWWLSPPCQPYTRRGLGRHQTDPRNDAFSHLVSLILKFQPKTIGLENVPEFWGSLPCDQFITNLKEQNYFVAARFLCPTELGIPMKRKRFFLIASKKPLKPGFDKLVYPKDSAVDDLKNEPVEKKPLKEFVEEVYDSNEDLLVSAEDFQKYQDGMNVLFLSSERDIANCFTKAYGKNFSKSGSFLQTPEKRIRRFHPAEMLRLFGFPKEFQFPKTLSIRSQYALIGNSLSVDCVKHCLRFLTH